MSGKWRKRLKIALNSIFIERAPSDSFLSPSNHRKVGQSRIIANIWGEIVFGVPLVPKKKIQKDDPLANVFSGNKISDREYTEKEVKELAL